MSKLAVSALAVFAVAGSAMADKGDASNLLRGLNGGASDDYSVIGEGAGVALSIDVAGIESRDPFLSAGNVVLNFNLGAGAQVIGIGYDVTLTAFSPSWLSEMRSEFTDTGITTGVGLTPGFAESTPGTMAYSSGGIIDLVGLGLDFVVGGDGILRVEFHDTFDDFPGAADGLWKQGKITVVYVPTPASAAILGLGGLAAIRRRR